MEMISFLSTLAGRKSCLIIFLIALSITPATLFDFEKLKSVVIVQNDTFHGRDTVVVLDITKEKWV